MVRFKGLFSARKITNQFVFNIVAACCDFYSFGWMARHIAGQSPFRHYHTARRVSLADFDGQFKRVHLNIQDWLCNARSQSEVLRRKTAQSESLVYPEH